MVGVCFFFEDNDTDVWSGRHVDLDAWNYAALAAGDVDRLLVINRTSQILTLGGMFEVVGKPPSLDGKIARVVGPSDGDAVSLWEFDHDVAWYAFGPAQGWGDAPDFVGDIVDVTIPQSGVAALHSMHAASCVLLHRRSVFGG